MSNNHTTTVGAVASDLTAPQLADLFGQVIAEARREVPAVRMTALGSPEELNAIHLVVLRAYPDLGRAFLAWCKHRAENIEGSSANGVHVFSHTRIYTEVRKNGVYVDSVE